jgi:hypothetical protein
MTGIPGSIGLKTALGAALAAALLGACSLNPQPLPPDTEDASQKFGLADAQVADSGQVDAQAGGAQPDGASPELDGSSDGHIVEGGSDAADGSLKDVASEGSKEGGLSDGHAMDGEVP